MSEPREESLLEEACEVCGRRAVVILNDHQKREPVEVAGKLYQRHKSVRTRAYCRIHLRPPRVFGINGKLLED